MSKLSYLSRDVLKYRVSLFDPFRRLSSRSFSSVGEQQGQPAEVEQQEPVADTFYGSSQGAVYGRLTGFGRNTLKTDIIHFFEGSDLSALDVKFEYNNSFTPISMMLRFPSQSSYDAALRQTTRKGRLYKLDKINSGQWDITESHDGRTVLIQGIPSNAVREDIERFLSGCNFDPKSFRFISRNALQNTVKAVAFRVASGLEAVNFQIKKNRSLCFNVPVTNIIPWIGCNGRQIYVSTVTVHGAIQMQLKAAVEVMHAYQSPEQHSL